MNKMIKFTSKIQNLVISIGGQLERINQLPSSKPTLLLRKQNQIQTIFSTTKIEGNRLSLSEVTSIIEGKRVAGDKQQILEVQNTIKLYRMIDSLNPLSVQDFLLGHNILMNKLIISNGSLRKVNVGIQSAGKIKKVFPEFESVQAHISDLFHYINESNDNFIIKSCLIHYLIETIHPFEDGNGRIGRFWQSLYLANKHEIFKYVYIESAIKKAQTEYYDSLFKSQASDDPSLFVEFILKVIHQTLEDVFSLKFEEGLSKREMRFKRAKEIFESKKFSRRDYLGLFPSLSDSQGTKDLAFYFAQGLVEKSGRTNGAYYRFL